MRQSKFCQATSLILVIEEGYAFTVQQMAVHSGQTRVAHHARFSFSFNKSKSLRYIPSSRGLLSFVLLVRYRPIQKWLSIFPFWKQERFDPLQLSALI